MRDRIEIPVYTDRWMMGDRYGTIIKHSPRHRKGQLVVHVQLDKSGKVVKVVLADCREIA